MELNHRLLGKSNKFKHNITKAVATPVSVFMAGRVCVFCFQSHF